MIRWTKYFLIFLMLLMFYGCYYVEEPRTISKTTNNLKNYNKNSNSIYTHDPNYLKVSIVPPPSRFEYIPHPPKNGLYWIPGYWNWNRNGYIWQQGYYTWAKPGFYWRRPRFIRGRWYSGKWIKGKPPYWHYSLRSRAGFYYGGSSFIRYNSSFTNRQSIYPPGYTTRYKKGKIYKRKYSNPGKNRYYHPPQSTNHILIPQKFKRFYPKRYRRGKHHRSYRKKPGTKKYPRIIRPKHPKKPKISKKDPVSRKI
jgi:hypothetical protein